jgi:hypothetical protein
MLSACRHVQRLCGFSGQLNPADPGVAWQFADVVVLMAAGHLTAIMSILSACHQSA